MKSDSKISLRKAEFADMEFLFNLRNQPDVYEKSFNNRPVSIEEHIKWLTSIVSCRSNKEPYIIENFKIPVGQVRLNKDEPNSARAIISIAISREFRRKGFAKEALSLLIKEIKKRGTIKILIANVKKKNESSINLFEKLGFNFEGEDKKHKGFLKYILNLYRNDKEK